MDSLRVLFNPITTVRQHIVLIIVIAAVVTAASSYFVLKKIKPRYSTEAMININPYFPKILYKSEENDFVRSFEDWMRTQVNVIKSYPVIEQAINIYHSEGYTWRLPQESIKSAIGRLMSQIKVIQIRDTQIITISYSSVSPEGLSELVNAVVKSYLRDSQNQRETQDRHKLATLKNEREKIQNDLNSSYHALEEISLRYGTAITDEKNLYVYVDALNDLKRAYNRNLVEKINHENRIKALEHYDARLKKTDMQPAVDDKVETNPVLIDSEIQAHRSEQDILGQMSGLREDHPKYQYLKRKLDDLQSFAGSVRRDKTDREQRVLREKAIYDNAMAINRIRVDYETTVNTEQRLVKELERTQQEVLEFNTAVLRASTKRHDIQRLQDSLNRINERIDQILIEATTPGRIYVQSWAITPDGPTDDPRKKMLPACIVGGLVCGILVAFVIDILKSRVQKPADVEKVIGFPLTGHVIDSTLDRIEPEWVYRVFSAHPSSYMYSMYQRIALKFQKERTEHDSHIFTLFPVRDGDGATSLSINALAALDAKPERKLYIDLNYRSPLVRAFPQFSNRRGLDEWLDGLCTADDIIFSDDHFPFRIILSGRIDASSRITSRMEQIRAFLNELKKDYDYIFLDTPSLFVSSETQGLAGISDVSVLVAQAGVTGWGELIRSVKLLDKIGVRVVSVVLNRVQLVRGGYFREEIDNFYRRQGSEDG